MKTNMLLFLLAGGLLALSAWFVHAPTARTLAGAEVRNGVRW